jgi:hypothetical protein
VSCDFKDDSMYRVFAVDELGYLFVAGAVFFHDRDQL